MPYLTIPTSQSFRDHHPFEIPDGRRFASLYCAAASACQFSSDVSVTDTSTGHTYDTAACIIALRGPVPGFREVELTGERREV